MGRPKGYKLSDEQKQRMQEGRIASRQVKAPKIVEKPLLVLQGTEKDGFDFWGPLRETFRPIYQYDLCHKIEKEIVDPAIWKNYGIIISILEKYCIIKIGDEIRNPLKLKKKRNYIMTEEHKQKLRESRISRKGK